MANSINILGVLNSKYGAHTKILAVSRYYYVLSLIITVLVDNVNSPLDEEVRIL